MIFSEFKTGFSKENYCETSEMEVPVAGVGLNRGYAAFDFMKVIAGVPFYPDRHLARFARTRELLRIIIDFSEFDLHQIINEITLRNGSHTYGLKLFAVPRDEGNGEFFLSDLFIVPVELPVYSSTVFESGAKLICKEYSRFLPEAKSTNYLPSLYWENERKNADALEILYCFNGLVLETSKSNIFMVKNNEVFTPGENVLAGITRSITIDLLNTNRLHFSIKNVGLETLFSADEVFITSTTKGIAPITAIDGKKIANGKVGEISRLLMTRYSDLLKAAK